MKFVIGAILLMCVFGHTLATADPAETDPQDSSTKNKKSTTVKTPEKPPVSSENPPVSSENPPVSSENPPVSSENPPVSSENPPVSSENPPVSSENPPVSSEETPVSSEPKKLALKGLWKTEAGELKVCGHCLDSEGNSSDCDKKTGACPGKCAVGYSGAMCTEFSCEEGCGEGSCIAPNTCYCGDNINLDARTGCKDIRIRGLMGSAAALIVLTLVVFTCSSVSKSVRRKERARLAEMQKTE